MTQPVDRHSVLMADIPRRVWPGIAALCLLSVWMAWYFGSTGDAARTALDDPPPTDLDELLKTFRNEFVDIRPGQDGFPAEFFLGGGDVPHADPPRSVRFERPFRIGIYEIPQNLYEAVMGENPSRWKGPRNSAEMMTWQEAVTFCDRITELLRERMLIEDNELVRLPTEAEWEYCCRAGTDTAYSFGDEATSEDDVNDLASRLDEYAWHTGNAAGNDPPVGALRPNPWGLYDVHGYLWEFCLDDWFPSHEEAPADGATRRVTADSGESTSVVIKGGSWRDRYPDLRSRTRREFPRDGRSDAVGFRCVIVRDPDAGT